MKLELTAEQAALLRPLVEWCAATQSRDIVIGQVIPGDWRDSTKTWFVCTTIKAETGKKIRKLLEQETRSAKPAPVAAGASS